jgi:hypothetical protein
MGSKQVGAEVGNSHDAPRRLKSTRRSDQRFAERELVPFDAKCDRPLWQFESEPAVLHDAFGLIGNRAGHLFR